MPWYGWQGVTGSVSDRLILKGMEFYAYHGVLAEEKQLGQRFTVDVEMLLDVRPAAAADDLNLTINYAQVYDFVATVMQGESCRLLETLAEKIAAGVCQRYGNLVKEIVVRVYKPQVPLPGLLEYAAVEIRRRCHEYEG